MPLKLKGGSVKDIIQIGDYSFEVRGLTRSEVYEFLNLVKGNQDALTSETLDPELQEKLEDFVIDHAVQDEIGKKLIKELPINEFRQVFDHIMKLSGLGTTSESKKSG